MLFKSCYKFHCSVCSAKNDLSNNFEIDYFESDDWNAVLKFAKNYDKEFDYIVIYNGTNKISYQRKSKEYKKKFNKWIKESL